MTLDSSFAGKIKSGEQVCGLTGTMYPSSVVASGSWPNPRFTITYCQPNTACASQVGDCDATSTNDVVMDNLTGVMWSSNANINSTATWANHGTYMTALNVFPGICGYVDWRMPTREELASLVDARYASPAVPNTAGTGQWTAETPFVDVQNGNYWSSTESSASSATDAWSVDMTDGKVSINPKASTYYLWVVRP